MCVLDSFVPNSDLSIKIRINMNPIYHIVLPDSWAAQSNADTYRHESLEAEGFIHLSYAHQIEGVLERYYIGVEKVLI